jgi:YfiH family protein
MSARLGFAPDWPAPARVRAWVSGRAGGASAGTYATLNLATHVGDAPDRVAENRARLRANAALPAEPVWLEQVHGATVLDLDRDALAPADGAVTARAGVVCAVLTADCLPVIFADRAGSRVGVAHAGWRGLLNGVLPAAVRALRAPPSEIVAWLGPAISAAAYEVGAEVRDAHLARDPGAERCFAPNRPLRARAREPRGGRRDRGPRRRVLHLRRERAILLPPARGALRADRDARLARAAVGAFRDGR